MNPLWLTVREEQGIGQELAEAGIRAYIPWRHDLGRLERMGTAYGPRRGF